MGEIGPTACTMAWSAPIPGPGRVEGLTVGQIKSTGKLNSACEPYFSHPCTKPTITTVSERQPQEHGFHLQENQIAIEVSDTKKKRKKAFGDSSDIRPEL